MSNRLSGVRHAIGLLPENTLIGYVLFGTQIQVHELGFSDMFNVLISQVRRTTSFPLLASLSLSLSLSAFINFLLIMKIIIYKKELKVRGPLNEKR